MTMTSRDPARAAALDRLLARGLLVLASALLGFGLLMWVAANWDALGRTARFALLQGLLAGSVLTALRVPAGRAALTLLALLATGGLFAYFGQTYQTGADAWQLFALWAGLGLPLVLAARSDIVWAPWTLVTALAAALWVQAHTGFRWRIEARDLPVQLLGCGALLALNAALGPGLASRTGAGPWARRCMAAWTLLAVVPAALAGLFASDVRPQYGVGLGLLALATLWLATRRGFEVFLLSLVVLGLDVLLVGGLARVLFSGEIAHREPIVELLLLGLAGAGLLALSVRQILRLARRHAAGRPA